jgi:glycosyltransferase involved in cell wall biosynthesis
MQEQVNLTIAIPTYTRADALQRLVRSVIPQLLEGDELLVVNDNSQDNTESVLNLYPDVTKISHASNQGMVRSWNDCLRFARNSSICIVHDDDEIGADALRVIRYVCSMVEKPALITHSNIGHEIDDCFRYRFVEAGSWAVLNSSYHPSGVTINRAIIDRVGLFDERFKYSTDIEYFARVAAQFDTIVIENPLIVKNNIHLNNYQYKTWTEPDFMEQLISLENLVIEYANLNGSVARENFEKRMTVHLSYMLQNAIRLGNKKVAREAGRALAKQADIGLRRKVRAYTSSVLGWSPV